MSTLVAAAGVAMLTLSAMPAGGVAPSSASPGPTGRTSSATPPTYAWPKIAHDAGNSGLSDDPGISTLNAGGLGVRWMTGTGAASVSSPVVAWNAELGETLVYLANNAGYLTAFDQSTGAVVWSEQLGSELLSTPLVEGGYVWVTRDYRPALYKLDAATGAIQCSTRLISTSEGSPTIGTPSGGPTSIYIGVNDLDAGSGPIYSVAESNCAVNWQFTDFNSIAGTWDPLSFATDATGRSLVLAGTADPDETVYAVDALTGKKVWSFQTLPEPGDPNADIDVGAGVAVSPPGADGFADGVAYVPGEDGYMYAFDLTSGALIWDTYFGTGLPPVHTARATPALVNGDVVFGESSGVMALNAVTGKEDWSFDSGGIESVSAAAALGPPGEQVVAVTTVAGAFDVLSAETGALLYQYQTPGYSTSSFADVDGNLLVASTDGFLYDLAEGGGNGPAPVTATTSPVNGSAVANPNGVLTLIGTATGDRIAGVSVAVQAGGSSGPWWDGQSGTWVAGYFDNAATVTQTAASHARWSYGLPVTPAGGSFRVMASATGHNGVADISALSPAPGKANITFTVRNAAGTPVLSTPQGPWVAPGAPVPVAGSGFWPHEPLAISLGGSPVGTATATSAGALPLTPVTIPATATFGLATLVVTGQDSGLSAAAKIDISNAWTGSGYDASHTAFEPNDPILLQTPSPGPPSFLNQLWSDPIGSAVRTSVAISKGTAYFGDDAGGITALMTRNGEPRWSVTESSPIDSSPAVKGSLVVFGTEGGTVTALDTSNGDQAWSTPTSSAVESSPAVTTGNVVVGSDDGTVYDLSPQTGAVKWAVKLAGAVTASPSVDPGRGLVVVGDASGTVTALSIAHGNVVWQTSTGGPVTAAASLYNGVAYVGSGDGDVYALSETTGQVHWMTPTTGAVTAGGVVYASISVPDYYVVGSQDGTVRLLGLTDGAVDAETGVGGPVVGLAASVGWITVSSSNGQLWGLKRLGEPNWELGAPAGFAAPATVVDGVVYTGSSNQTVSAYGIPGRTAP